MKSFSQLMLLPILLIAHTSNALWHTTTSHQPINHICSSGIGMLTTLGLAQKINPDDPHKNLKTFCLNLCAITCFNTIHRGIQGIPSTQNDLLNDIIETIASYAFNITINCIVELIVSQPDPNNPQQSDSRNIILHNLLSKTFSTGLESLF
jgi:hypothetical protein